VLVSGRVCGLDPAITETGLTDSDGVSHRLLITPGRAARIDPNSALLAKIDLIRDWCSRYTDQASLVVMEEPYIDPHHLSSVKPLYFLQHALLRRFRIRRTPVILVVPAQVKAYAVGGRASKEEVHDAALTLGWAGPTHPDRNGRNFNESDSYVCWAIARHIEDGEPLGPPAPPKLVKYRRELVTDLAARLTKAAA
jgi:hypothetical protein